MNRTPKNKSIRAHLINLFGASHINMLTLNFNTRFTATNMRIRLRQNERNPKIFKRDIQTLIAAYVTQGSNLERSIKLSRKKQGEYLSRLQKKYNIQHPKSRSFLEDPIRVTLPRIAKSFPQLTCLARSVCPDPFVLPSKWERFPKYMMTKAFASLIPRKDEPLFKYILKKHLEYILEEDVIINKTFKQDWTYDQKKYLLHIFYHYDVSFKSELYNDSEREAILKQDGVLDIFKKLYDEEEKEEEATKK